MDIRQRNKDQDQKQVGVSDSADESKQKNKANVNANELNWSRLGLYFVLFVFLPYVLYTSPYFRLSLFKSISAVSFE